MAKPRVIKTLKGAGKVYDWRGTGLLPPNGGVIPLRLMVEHIPVIRNQQGTGDFLLLARVLKQQGLSLQAATDAEGNVALYNDLNRLCYQAKGANSVSCGVEHMHYSTGEDWTRRQLRASAWLWQYAEHKHGLPMRGAKLGRGQGTVSVYRSGHTSHQKVSAAAGYNDRSDPGPKYDWEYVAHAARFYKRYGAFVAKGASGKTISA